MKTVLKLFLMLLLISSPKAFSQESKDGNIKKPQKNYHTPQVDPNSKVRLGIIGLSHGHARLVFRSLNSNKIQIIGIAESNPALIARFKEQYNLPEEIFFEEMEEMINEVNPEAVAVYTSTYDHLEVVKKCAPRGIHIMVEKPLAVSAEHAEVMQDLAEEHGVFLVTNYETTWHPSLNKVNQMVFEEKRVGEPRKFIFHHGNNGPKRGRGVDEFVTWLTDPVLNGGGALMDFGCYGINLLSWWLKGEKPISVFATTRQTRADAFYQVEDDAVIILNYKSFQCIIMASWNWAIPRKDVEIYGEKGYLIVDDATHYRYRWEQKAKEVAIEMETKFPYPVNEPFDYFVDLIRGKAVLEPFAPGSIQNNQLVMEILDAAKKSVVEQRIIPFP